MNRIVILSVLAILLIGASVEAQVTWSTITGPVNETSGAYNHIGTDGATIYVVFQNNQLWKYTFTSASPTTGTWARLADPPRSVCDWDSYSDLAYQSGYLYTSALANTEARTVLRYQISGNTWEVWQNAGVDINACNLSGQGLIMDPTTSGKGYCGWHGSVTWVEFNWTAKTADNSWITPPSAVWMSRNEDIATDGSGNYYATGNDQTVGLSSGDIIYRWSGLAKGAATSLLAQKPWAAGFGQSIEVIPGATAPSGHNELWMIRGSDSTGSPGEGWGNPSSNWARLDLTNPAGGWSISTLPGNVAYNGEIVRANGCVFVRGVGANWYTTKLGAPLPPPTGITPAASKTLAVGTSVNVAGVVTAAFSGASQFYIENRLRCSGIQVRNSGAPALDQSVVVHGTIRTDAATKERYVLADSWETGGSPETIRPLTTTARQLGGAGYGLQDGVYGGQGLNNVGMLVKITGRVTGFAADRSYIYVLDGSGCDDGAGTEGVRVDISPLSTTERNSITLGDTLVCTGISSMYAAGGHYNRMVRIRSNGDLNNLDNDGNKPITKKVMVINFDPIIEASGNKRLSAVYWPTHDPQTVLAPGYNNDLNECSSGYITYQIVEWVNADYYPIKTDGFQYTDATYTAAMASGGPWHSPDSVDYVRVLTDKYYSYNSPKTVIERVAAGDIDEVYMFGAPYFGYYESCLVGPSPWFMNGGTFTMPAAGRNFPVMGFNYERYIGEMLEDYGHRSECTMWRVYGSWNAYPPQHNWDYFTLLDKNIVDHNLYTAGCGNVHFAPNSLTDYQWGRSTYVWSTCDDWLNNWPNLTGTKRQVNRNEWGGGDIRLHHKWWFKHFPDQPGINPDGKQNNWWKYLADFNNYAESR